MRSKKVFIRSLAEYLSGNPAERSIRLSMGDKNAQEWANLRGHTPIFGYPSVEETEKILSDWLFGNSE
jgi:hypothetical protein